MRESIVVTGAAESDIPRIKEILIDAALPVAGVDEHWRTFVVVRDGGRMIACAGAEAYPTAALLRSFAVLPEYQSEGIGRRLVRELIDRLVSRGIREFYLLTESAESFFANRGFKRIDRDEINPQVTASQEFQGACPKSAIAMRLVML